MLERVDRVARQPKAPRGAAASRGRGRLALELVALRGKDVVGVRHLVDGGTAWIGGVAGAIARVPGRDLGGEPQVVGEVRSGKYSVCVPPRARARRHGWDGVPRLLTGPERIELGEGERAVVMLGQVQIRAQVVPFEGPPARIGRLGALVVGLLAIAFGYAAVAAVASAVASRAEQLEPGTLERVQGPLLPVGK
jgi:hypothetical protein